MTAAVVNLTADSQNTGQKIDLNTLTVSSVTVLRQNICLADPTVAAGIATVGASNAALSETATAALRTASGLFALDTAASAGSQQVPLQVESTAQPNLKTSLWSGGNEAAVKAASTAAAAADKALVVSLSPNSPPVGTFTAWASLPALTTGQSASLQTDPTSNLKVGVAPLGTPIYASANGGAQANNVTLTIPANKMGYLDGFDIDGLGATSGSAIAVTVTGLLGGTLTFSVGIVAGATTPITPCVKRFNPPLQGSAVNTNIVVNVPSFGSGNTAASANAYGHYI